MSIGYACLTLGVKDTEYKSCTMKNADPVTLTKLIDHNLQVLDHMINYNISNDIRLFRISSDIIPFGSSPVNKLFWWEIFDDRLKAIGQKIKSNRIRVSMHPGQYTVINSNNEDVVKRAIDDLEYHNRVLSGLGVDASHKIILHVGGVYNDKSQAIARFVSNFDKLGDSIKQRLVIENDEKLYHIKDVLEIGSDLKIPVVYDNLHNTVNPFDPCKSDKYWIDQCGSTWKEQDGLQKTHYSQQNPFKKPGAHSDSIRIRPFIEYYESLGSKDLDIMLEVKDKNISAVKCINCIQIDPKKTALEKEWGRYKYKILENSQAAYLEIRQCFRNDQKPKATDFYRLIEEALGIIPNAGSFRNAAQHVWGYFKNLATEKEQKTFTVLLDNLADNVNSFAAVKKFLLRMAVRYDQDYLLESYYFVL